MPQSLAALYAHIVFSTKGRAPALAPEWRPRLFEILGGVARKKKCVLMAAGGVLDHVHLLVSLHRESSIARLVCDLKANSSNWVHRVVPDMAAFDWQDGYAAFSVSYSQLGRVKGYVARQEAIHSGVSFQHEVRQLLTKHGIPFDERYVWD